MSEIPEFKLALSDLRGFLVEHGLEDEVLWVFRDDLWLRWPNRVLMRYPPPLENKCLAEKVYEEGRRRAIVGIEAVATANGHVATTVWFPKYPEEEVQGWPQGLKLSIRQPLPAAHVVSGSKWRVVRYFPGYRCYQRHECSIGSRRWAAR